GGVESRVRESDGGDRIDREMGRIFGVGRKSSPENFSDGCGGGRRLPDIWEGEERVMRESGYHQKDRKPSQNDKTEHGMEKTVQNQGQSPKMSKSESILKNQQSNRSRN
ncbi:hypothetical protein Tco_1556435, partial [Tanacetum coccineum]